MVSAQILNCMVCEEPVRPRQQAIQCDGCFRWNHRICNTGKFSTLLHVLSVFEFAAYILRHLETFTSIYCIYVILI